jgi:hypothetical protein
MLVVAAAVSSIVSQKKRHGDCPCSKKTVLVDLSMIVEWYDASNIVDPDNSNQRKKEE